MKPMVFTVNRDNMIELSKKELQELLDEAYNQGKNDGSPSYPIVYPYNWWEKHPTVYPSWTVTTSTSPSVVLTGATGTADVSCDAYTETNKYSHDCTSASYCTTTSAVGK